MGEGIFIGNLEELARSSKGKIIGQREGGCWKYLSFLLLVATGEKELNQDVSCKTF